MLPWIASCQSKPSDPSSSLTSVINKSSQLTLCLYSLILSLYTLSSFFSLHICSAFHFLQHGSAAQGAQFHWSSSLLYVYMAYFAMRYKRKKLIIGKPPQLIIT